MATILNQATVCDGHDVRCLLSNGERLTWHFQVQPADVQATVDALEASHLAALVPAEEEPTLEIVEG
jgi:hypothetical protein